jgi:hypothetical protein
MDGFATGFTTALLVCEDDELVYDELKKRQSLDLFDFVFTNDRFRLILRDRDLMDDIGSCEASKPDPYRLYLLFNLFIQHYIYLFALLCSFERNTLNKHR